MIVSIDHLKLLRHVLAGGQLNRSAEDATEVRGPAFDRLLSTAIERRLVAVSTVANSWIVTQDGLEILAFADELSGNAAQSQRARIMNYYDDAAAQAIDDGVMG